MSSYLFSVSNHKITDNATIRTSLHVDFFLLGALSCRGSPMVEGQVFLLGKITNIAYDVFLEGCVDQVRRQIRDSGVQVMQGFYLFLYNKSVFAFSHPNTGFIRCADSLFPIEELLSILCTAGAILREAIFVIDWLCPVG